MADYELYHHGIKGMKWGVRRYQKPDGSLTAMGRARQKLRDRSDRKKAEKAKKAENERVRNLMRKPISKLTDAEIAERYARKTKEKQLIDVESQIERMSKEPESIIKRLAGKALNDVAIPALIDAGKSALTSKIKSTLLDSFGLKNDLKVVKEAAKVLSEDDKLKQEVERWRNMESIARSKKSIDDLNKEPVVDDDEKLRREAERYKNLASIARSEGIIAAEKKKKDQSNDGGNDSEASNDSYTPEHAKASTSSPESKPEKHNDSGQNATPNKPQKMNSTEKTVDADYKETGPQRSTSKPDQRSTKERYDDLVKSGYKMSDPDGKRRAEAGESVMDRLIKSGYTMTRLSDLQDSDNYERLLESGYKMSRV